MSFGAPPVGFGKVTGVNILQSTGMLINENEKIRIGLAATIKSLKEQMTAEELKSTEANETFRYLQLAITDSERVDPWIEKAQKRLRVIDSKREEELKKAKARQVEVRELAEKARSMPVGMHENGFVTITHKCAYVKICTHCWTQHPEPGGTLCTKTATSVDL